MTRSLETVRRAIDAVDDSLIALLKQRMELVAEAAAVKAETGSESFSHARENFLFEHFRELAHQHDLPEDLAEDLLKRILRESYAQTGEGAYPNTYLKAGNIVPDGTRPKIVIIGGRGGMGRIFVRYFTASGYQVESSGSRDWDTLPPKLKGAVAVIVTVPIDRTVAIIERLAPLLDQESVLCDFTSVKTPAVEAMLRCHKGPVLGLHPMFGPDTKNLIKQVMVCAPGRCPEKSVFLEEQFAYYGMRLVHCSAQEHDAAMSIIQGLRHFTTYCYGLFLAGVNPDLKKILELSSPIYRLELMMVGRLFAQAPELYCDIIMSSRRNKELIRAYAESLKPLIDIIDHDDRDEFIARFLKARAYFGDHADIFLTESLNLLCKLQDERTVG